jgi:hypothetical protein
MPNNPQLSIELIWEDFDLEQLRISADNGSYRGVSEVYFSNGQVGELLRSIRAFPTTISHVVVFEGGSDDSGAMATLRFSCIDGSGHAVVSVSLAQPINESGRPGVKNRVELELAFEPAALDTFCQQLDALASRASTTAVLRGLVDCRR